MPLRAGQRIVGRRLEGDEDWWRLRSFLGELVPLTAPGSAWNVRRLDGRRFYTTQPVDSFAWQSPVQLWETEGGRLVAAVNDESPGEAHLHVHPAFRSVEPELVAWAEEHLAAPAAGRAERSLELAVLEHDTTRREVLRERGYEDSGEWGMTYRLRFPLAAHARGHELPPGYVLRGSRLDDPDDGARIADLLNAAFGRNFHTAGEHASFARNAPSFCAALDLVVVAPDGSFASYVAISSVEAGGRAIVEPVCTSPGHRGLGLARELLRVGLERAESRGAVDVVVETGSSGAANALYVAAGFSESCRATTWRKTGL